MRFIDVDLLVGVWFEVRIVALQLLPLAVFALFVACTDDRKRDLDFKKVSLSEKEGFFNSGEQRLIDLSIDYKSPGMKATFRVFTEFPYDARPDGTITEKEYLAPCLAGYTDENGVFNGLFELPTTIVIVYLYTPNAMLPTCVKLKVDNNRVEYKRIEYQKWQIKPRRLYQEVVCVECGVKQFLYNELCESSIGTN